MNSTAPLQPIVLRAIEITTCKRGLTGDVVASDSIRFDGWEDAEQWLAAMLRAGQTVPFRATFAFALSQSGGVALTGEMDGMISRRGLLITHDARVARTLGALFLWQCHSWSTAYAPDSARFRFARIVEEFADIPHGRIFPAPVLYENA